MRLGNIHKILFITLSNIGDVILTLPLLSALKDNFPNRKIDVVVGSRPREIFTKDPGINRVFTYNKHMKLKEKRDFIKRLKAERYDLAVDMRNTLIPFLIGAKNRTSFILANKGAIKHKKSIHLNRLKALGIEYKEKSNIYIDNKDREAIGRLLEENGVEKNDILIGVGPACRSPLKQWRIEGFIELIHSLLKKGNYKIVLVGDDTQINVSGEIKSAVNDKGLIDLTGKTNLNELFALVERMHVLLTCDSACMHIVCDLGVKVLAIFGPTDPEEYGPTGKNDIVIRKKLKCSPCKKASCRFNHECMKEITSGEVLEAVRKLL